MEIKSQPILSILIPAYNVSSYLEKCIYSILPYEYPSSELLEIIIVNDGSNDNTLEIAQKLAARYPQIIVINKENGGHGSTINAALKEARGRYFRIIDGDDWVDTQNFIKFFNLLKNTDADLVLTDASYEFSDIKELKPYVNYNITSDVLMSFEDLLSKESSFSTFGPVLASSTYKLDKLRDAKFVITEHSAYVDMEFNAFAIKNVSTIIYYKLDIYRYLIGRSGQTVSPDVWKRKYTEHKNIICNLVKYVENNTCIGQQKLNYIINKLISPMVDSQIFIYDQIKLLPELKIFLQELSQHEKIYAMSISYVYSKNGDSKRILNNLERKLANPMCDVAMHEVNNREQVNVSAIEKKVFGSLKLLKKFLKCILPYGIIRLYQKKKYGF